MANALTPKQEAFAQAIVAGMSQADAYRFCYDTKAKDSAIYARASELMADGKVAGRVAELRAEAAKAAQITLESHLADLHRLRNLAQASNQLSAAIAAEVARGKAAGITVDRVEHTGKGGGPIRTEAKIDAAGLTDEQLLVLAGIPVRSG